MEAEVRLQIDRRLRAKGWVLDPEVANRDVFVERAVIPRLSRIHQSRLSDKSPDYTLFSDGVPVAVLEAKKPAVSIRKALEQGLDYAERIDVDFVFACNGPTFKTLHRPTEDPLFLNHVEVCEPLPPARVRKFRNERTNDLVTVPDQVIRSRDELIAVFEGLNNTLRSAGIRAGLDRFTEFANLLFLKLLSERDETNGLWLELLHKRESDLPTFLNDYVIGQLRSRYNSEVLSRTQIEGKALKSIILELNPLRLSSVDEDIKGVAFEHFLRRTTAVQNDLGEYFTPRHVVRFMVRILNPQYGKTVFDPFCGTGGFLTEGFRHLGHQTKITEASYEQLHSRSLFGREITKNARIAKMNMILFGDGHSGVVQGDSLSAADDEYDYVLSNIPFSLRLDADTIKAVDAKARDADEACLLRCFNSLRQGGAMAVVVPDGLVVNRDHKRLWRRLCRESRIRAIASLPRGSFAPYTEAGTKILYLTDKGTKKTDWFYDVTLEQEHSDAIGMEEFQFFYQAADEPPEELPLGVDVVRVENLESAAGFYFERPWKVDDGVATKRLDEIADLRNGTSITEETAVPGEFPVIAGGRGSVPYTHNESNAQGGCFTVSKSGAYSGYVWWHENPIWSSDSIVVRSLDEEKFLTFYIYLCLKTKQDEIYLRQQGTGQPHIYKKHVQGFPIPILSIDDQRDYVRRAREAHQHRLIAQRNERQAVEGAVSILKKLFVGS